MLSSEAESEPRQDVLSCESVTVYPIKPFPGWFPRRLFLLYAPLKILFQIIQLLWTLLITIPPPDLILVQVRVLSKVISVCNLL